MPVLGLKSNMLVHKKSMKNNYSLLRQKLPGIFKIKQVIIYNLSSSSFSFNFHIFPSRKELDMR